MPVLPLNDRIAERSNGEIAGRPALTKGRSQLLFSGAGRLGDNVVTNLKNKSHAVTAELVLTDCLVNGVIVAQGGGFVGWSLYAEDGLLEYRYNLLGMQRFCATYSSELLVGKHQVRMEFAYDGEGLAKEGTSDSISMATTLGKSASRRPSRYSCPWTRRWTSGAKAAQWSPRTTLLGPASSTARPSNSSPVLFVLATRFMAVTIRLYARKSFIQ